MINLGLILAFCTAAGWALMDALMGFSVATIKADPIMFTCIAQIGGGGILLAIAGPGKLAMETLKAPHTWGHGLLSIATTIFYTLALVFITATELNFIMRIDAVLILFLSAFFLGRKIHRDDWIGISLISTGVIAFAINLNADIRAAAIFLAAMSTIFHVIRTMEAEKHPTSIKAKHDIRNRCRVTGIVLLIMGIVFFGLYLSFSTFIGEFVKVSSENMPILLDIFPKEGIKVTTETVYSGLAVGALTMAPAYYFYLYATVVAGASTVLMMLALMPFITFAIEWSMAQFNLVNVAEIGWQDLGAGLIIVAGAMYIIYGENKRKNAKPN